MSSAFVPNAARASADPTLLELLAALLRRRVFVVRLALAGAVVGGVLALLSARTYTADFSFTPQESNSAGGLSAIASDFGLNIAENASQSPEFYQNLIHTREILWRMLETKFTIGTPHGPVSFVLLDSLVPVGNTREARREKGAALLTNDIRSRIDLKTSVLWVGVRTWSPELAVQMATQLIAEINRFNAETRRSRAAAQREFAQQRVAETRVALRAAQDREEAWATRNKIFIGSPELLFEKARLDRDLALVDQEYVTIMQQYNAARMDEVRNVPVITIIEKPVAPTKHDPRGVVTKTLLGGFLGFAVGILLSVLLESLRRSTETLRDDAKELNDLRAEIVRELKHPIGIARQIFFLAPSGEKERRELH